MNETVTIAERLAAGETAYAFTKGVSMQPLLYQGRTHVILKPLDRPLKVGDLPIYLRPDGVYVIHRLVKIEEGFYHTRGDNCINSEKITQDMVIGIVSDIYRRGRYISVTDKKYRLYVGIWMLTAPLRIGLKKTKYKLARLKNDKNK